MAAREVKIRKYSDNPGIDAAIKSKPGVVEVIHCPLIITSREIWCLKYAEDLIGLDVLNRKDIRLMSVRVIEGSLKVDAESFNGKEWKKRKMKTGCGFAHGHHCSINS